jgi:hypothetical protein
MEHAVDFAMRWGHVPIIGLILAHMHGVRFSFRVWRNGSPMPRVRWRIYVRKDVE